MDVRVRLVFADDVGRHVQRRRGFSSCWYLVPNDVKLVGDFAHVLLQEFGLRKCCPRGLELHLEELPVLATQSIRVVRDDDTIVVHCPALEGEGLGVYETSSSESELDNWKLRKRKAREKKEDSFKKKAKMTQDGSRVILLEHQKCAGKSKVETLVGVKKSCSGTASSSSSSSGSNSSESEDEFAICRDPKRFRQTATTNKQLPDEDKDAVTTRVKALVCDAIASKTNAASGRSKKQPRRKRRRLRQRSGGRRRNDNQNSSADKSASIELSSGDQDTASQAPKPVATTLQLPKKNSSTERQNGSGIAGSKGKRCGKSHVFFDEETGGQVEVKHDEDPCHLWESFSTVKRSPAPELARYGPSSIFNQRSRFARDNQGRSVSSPSGLIDRKEEANVYDDAPQQEEKRQYGERWKRPYKIVATVLDKKSEKSASSSANLAELLCAYPTAPGTSFHFVSKDVVAYKTLTLCLETWQPLLSEWQCGQVQSIDASGDALELSKWILTANGDSIDFREERNAEHYSVQTSEISELRFLSGSSFSSLQQTDDPTHVGTDAEHEVRNDVHAELAQH